jgi:hypothetical protein
MQTRTLFIERINHIAQVQRQELSGVGGHWLSLNDSHFHGTYGCAVVDGSRGFES